MKKFSVYLAGPIEHQTMHDASKWRNQIEDGLLDSPQITVLNPMRHKYSTTHFVDGLHVFQRDMHDVATCDIAVVKWVEELAMRGTSFELGTLYHRNVPLIWIGPRPTHPLIREMCRRAVRTNVEGAIDYLQWWMA